MGQLARYPVHWHLAGDKSGDFLRDSSIHHSFQRCVTVHGTHNVEIANNVCFDHFGHGYFLEDGDETGNAFLDNLAIEVVPVVDDSECLVGIVSYVDLIGFLLKGR